MDYAHQRPAALSCQACDLRTSDMKKTSFGKQPKNIVGPRVLKARLERCGITQEDLAGRLAALGVTADRSAISRIESQQRYVMDYEAEALAKALKVTISWLYNKRR